MTRIGPGEIDVTRRCRGVGRLLGALAAVQVVVEVDEDGFAGFDVAHDPKPRVSRATDRGGDEVFGAGLGLVLP